VNTTKQIKTVALVAVIISVLGACTPHDSVEPCFAGQISRVYLGQLTPSGTVSDADFQRFIADVVTPKFPSGFTILPGEGQWRSKGGEMHREATRVLEIAHDHNPYTRARVHDLANDYKRRFAQQSVLVTQVPSYQCS
jgi:Protein of unknown function (DUF3574)